MKKLLVDALFRRAQENKMYYADLDKIQMISTVLSKLPIHGEPVALITNNKQFQIYFQLACLFKGISYVIIDSALNVDTYVLTHLSVKTLFIERDCFYNIPSSIKETTFVNLVLDIKTLLVIEEYIEKCNSFYLTNKINTEMNYYMRKHEQYSSSVFDSEQSKIDIFKYTCVDEYRNSTIFVIHPGNGYYGTKISILNEEILFKGFLHTLDTLGKEMSNLKIPMHSSTFENVSYPYVFIHSVLLPIIAGKTYTVGKTNNSGYIFISAVTLKSQILDIIENSVVLSLFYKYKSLRILKYILRYKFYSKIGFKPTILIYGKIDKVLQKFLNFIGVKVFYLYTMIEVSNFIDYKYYSKIPLKKELSVGKLPKNTVLNGKDINNNSELLISLDRQFISYTDTDFSELCNYSEKHMGMHSTFDICEEIKGELYIKGKAEELLINQNGLMIQHSLIYSILLNNPYVADALIVFKTVKNTARAVINYTTVLVALVELRVSMLLLNDITSNKVIEKLNTSLLPAINKKVEPYSKISAIVLIPMGFERDPNGNIKTSRYRLNS